jgi:hypothetical protein
LSISMENHFKTHAPYNNLFLDFRTKMIRTYCKTVRPGIIFRHPRYLTPNKPNNQFFDCSIVVPPSCGNLDAAEISPIGLCICRNHRKFHVSIQDI